MQPESLKVEASDTPEQIAGERIVRKRESALQTNGWPAFAVSRQPESAPALEAGRGLVQLMLNVIISPVPVLIGQRRYGWQGDNRPS
jgi:hypothetical protein